MINKKPPHIIHKNLNFLENGAYYVEVNYVANNLIIKLLSWLKLIKPHVPVVEISDSDAVNVLNIQRKSDFVVSGSFLTRKGEKKLVVNFGTKTIDNFTAQVVVEKLYN